MLDRRQLTVGVASQALSSLTNFLLVIAVARTSTPFEFGGFAISYSLALLALGIGRGLVGDTLSVVAAEYDVDSTQRSCAPVSAALMVGFIAGGLMVLGGFAVRDGAIGGPLIVFGLFLPLVIAQDAVRFVGFANQRARLAFLSDAVWLATQLAGFLVLAALHETGVGGYVAVWGVSAGLAAAVAFPDTKFPKFRTGSGWLRQHHSLSLRFAGEFTVGSGASHLTLYLVGGLAGLPAAGALRAAESMYGPLNSVTTGLQSVLLPAASRGDVADRPAPLRLGLRIGAGFAALAGSGALVLTLLPVSVGAALLGESWPATSPLLLPLGVMYIGAAIMRGMLVSLKAMHAASTALAVRSVTGALLLTLGGIGVWLAGAFGAATGMAVAQMVGAVVAGIATSRISADPSSGQEPRDERLPPHP